MASFLLILSRSFFLRALGLGKVNSRAVSRLWKDLCGKGLVSPAYVREYLRLVSEWAWKWIFRALSKPCWYIWTCILFHVGLEMTPVLADNLVSVLRESLCKKHIATPPWFITHRDCEIIRIGCFRLLCFVIICYTAVDNEHVCISLCKYSVAIGQTHLTLCWKCLMITVSEVEGNRFVSSLVQHCS